MLALGPDDAWEKAELTIFYREFEYTMCKNKKTKKLEKKRCFLILCQKLKMS